MPLESVNPATGELVQSYTEHPPTEVLKINRELTSRTPVGTGMNAINKLRSNLPMLRPRGNGRARKRQK